MSSSNDDNFVRFNPLSRYPRAERKDLREKHLRANDIAVMLEDRGISARDLVATGLAADGIESILDGHVRRVDLATIGKIEREALRQVRSRERDRERSPKPF